MKESNEIVPCVLDTNVLVRLLDKNDEQREIVERLFKLASYNKIDLIINSLIIAEVVWVLKGVYKLEKKLISKFINRILSSSGINKIESYSFENYLTSWENTSANFVDNIIATIPEVSLGEWGVVTFDQEFKQFNDIKIYDPKYIVKSIQI